MAGVLGHRRGRGPRHMDEQGDVEGVVVGEEAVPELLLFPEGLAVVRGDDDDGPGQGPRLLEGVEEAPELGVDEGGLARIRIVRVLRPEGLRRRVGIVQVEHVDPGEPLPGLGRNPVQGRSDDLVGRPFDDVEVLVLGEPRVVVIEVEALVEPKTGIEDEGADESGGPVAAGLEDLGQGLVTVLQPEARVVADPVIEGCRSRHDVGVGGPRQGRLGIGAGEHGRPAGQGVEMGGPDVAVGQDAHPVVPEGIDGDQ